MDVVLLDVYMCLYVLLPKIEREKEEMRDGSISVGFHFIQNQPSWMKTKKKNGWAEKENNGKNEYLARFVLD